MKANIWSEWLSREFCTQTPPTPSPGNGAARLGKCHQPQNLRRSPLRNTSWEAITVGTESAFSPGDAPGLANSEKEPLSISKTHCAPLCSLTNPNPTSVGRQRLQMGHWNDDNSSFPFMGGKEI
ncbi:hypothetical protein mRhiFer1_009203 [Rhinolophus ferrumequinum]|uniref:Uncharacterized protein n=1 Tax=Rhinolophus ferrumequinum TaxID=59479 RepID=A0A7J7SJ99_RHIFE|nr:hypothetical protein mRhiFer1_009203 [Rhinolophus ferrumequinum]